MAGGIIVTPEYREFSDKVVQYMQDVWNLSWRYGQSGITDVVLQRSAVGPQDFRRESLIEEYHQKAVFIKNIAPSNSWYASHPGHLPTSNPPVSGHDSTESQTSMEFREVGNG
ncbi:hypothetical protein K449DRAFT_427952 [Hypoxylon sp. EC38]|nr:hypothetical protein K449DRAFT_427952 [Hypoxylon sp. EC38]